MSRIAWLALLGLVAAPAFAAGSRADIQVIDRETGRALPVHHHNGEYWVAGRPGALYAIRYQSRDGRRLLAVTSVDGVNILTGETAAHDQRGYVLEPYQGYEVAGWRKSNSEIAAFTFTSIPKSYAARTGRAANVGVIGLALFREKPRVAADLKMELPAPPPTAMHAPSTADAEELEETQVTGTRIAQQRSDGDAAGAAAESRERRAQSPSLGTGHGRREVSVIHTVPFERASDRPDEIIRIRYDSHENLVAMGVIREARPQPRPLDPFPGSRLGYVPDP
jgi:hypothetical protein